MATQRRARVKPPSPDELGIIDLDHYVPAYLTWIANKLSRGASQTYLKVFNIGIETWRCLVLLAIHRSISAQRVSQIIGMDKASVSRCFKSMQARGLIVMGLDASGSPLTPLYTWADTRAEKEGREMHQGMDERKYHSRTGDTHSAVTNATSHERTRWQRRPRTSASPRYSNFRSWMTRVASAWRVFS